MDMSRKKQSLNDMKKQTNIEIGPDNTSHFTYSEDSILSVVGIIISIQFNKIVVMMIIEKSGWTSM